MSIIYEPRGKAREYSPLALNLYIGCTHKCAYCYAPSCLMKSPEDYFSSPAPRAKFINTLGRELEKKSPKKQVLLSFIGDVYCEAQDNNALTRAALEVLLDAKVPVAILTKGGSRCVNYSPPKRWELPASQMTYGHLHRLAIGQSLPYCVRPVRHFDFTEYRRYTDSTFAIPTACLYVDTSIF